MPDEVRVKDNNNEHQNIPSNFGANIGAPKPIEPVKANDDTSFSPVNPISSFASESGEVSDKSPVLSEDEYEYIEEDSKSGFVVKVDELMQDLNLDRRHFVIFSGCFSLLVVTIIISFVLLFKFFGEETQTIVAPVNTTESIHAESSEGFMSKWFNFGDDTKSNEEIENSDLKTDDIKTDSTDSNAEESSEPSLFNKFFGFLSGDKESSVDDTVNSEEEVDEGSEEIGFIKSLFTLSPNEEEYIEDDSENNNESIMDQEDNTDDIDPDPDPVAKTSITVSSQLGDMTNSEMYSIGLKTAIYYGRSSITDDKISYYIRTYRKVRNIFNTDLFNYLNNTSNRSLKFDEFLGKFKGANEEAKLAYEDLRQEIDLYTNRYNKINARANTVEQEFFESLDVLASEDIPELLESFQELSSQRIVIKSELSARTAVAEKYAKALPIIAKKIEAIEVNRDPYVKGVKVVEFNQVDLDLVLQGT